MSDAWGEVGFDGGEGGGRSDIAEMVLRGGGGDAVLCVGMA
jgi:hypothetical protein